MQRICGIDRAEGKWYKGNLHCHSTESDGALAPAEVIQKYRQEGYSFLSFTEHDIFSARDEFDGPDFRVIPGIERSVTIGDTERVYHLNGFFGYGCSARETAGYGGISPREQGIRLPAVSWKGIGSAQSEVDDLNRAGYLVTLNHPVWSRNRFLDLEELTGYFAVEIYNHGCEVECRTGVATPFWDCLLRSGRRVFGLATDDNHNKNPYGDAAPEWDSFGGWVMVNSRELTASAIASSLREGAFYSSSGPEIYSFGIDGDKAYVECSPVEAVYFIRYPGHGHSRRSKTGSLITGASVPLSGKESYLRVECVDERGRTAWTNPVFF